MNNKKVGFKEVWRALKQIPKTITIIRKVDKKGFTLIVMLSMIAGAFPVITLVLSQELINSIVKKSLPLRYTIILFTIYIIVSFLGSILGEAKDYFLKKYWSISALFIRQNTSILKRKTLFNILYELSIQIVSAIIIGVAIMSAYVGEILVGNVMSYIRSVGLVQTNSQAIISYGQDDFEFQRYADDSCGFAES